ncbi:MAG: hypothetical protein ACKOGA_22480 [Planctomycetaceae bacterium]
MSGGGLSQAKPATGPDQPMRLEIAPIRRLAEEVRDRIQAELPTHSGLARLANATARIAGEAGRMTERLGRFWGLHRLPLLFVVLSLLGLGAWVYSRFFSPVTLRIGVPDRDAQELRERLVRQGRIRLRLRTVPGSREAVAELLAGTIDLGYVQGGFDVPVDLPRLTMGSPELILWLTRGDRPSESVRRVLTSDEGEGSHTVARQLFAAWRHPHEIAYRHEWKRLAGEEPWRVPDDVDAVLVVKNPADDGTLRACERLVEQGFLFRDVRLGARGRRLDYLTPHTIPAGWFKAGEIPHTEVESFDVATSLIGRRGMTPAMLATVNRLLNARSSELDDLDNIDSLAEASDLFQGIEAFIGILIQIAIAFLALLGWEILAYRRQFHELNTLVSLISVHQSSKDVLGQLDPAVRRENLLYLSLCSDLLGLISMIAGYFTQENPSLLLNGMPEIIHQRCDGLKINIQLKILHATIDAPMLQSGAGGASVEFAPRAPG